MFSFIKSNNPSVAALNVLVLVLSRVLFLLHPTDLSYIYHHSEPASQWFIHLFNINGKTDIVGLMIAGGVLCFIESLLINQIINSHKVTTRKNFLGGLLFVLFSSMTPACMVLSPAMVAVLLLLLATDRVFELGKPDKLLGAIFDLGLLSSLAVCFYFPAIYFLLFVLMGFFTMRTTSIQGLLIILTGFATALITVFTIYFWQGSLHTMVIDLINIQNRIPFSALHLLPIEWAVCIGLAVMTLLAFAAMPGVLFSTVIQTRKYITVMIVGALMSVAVIPMAFNFNLSHLLFLISSASILYTVYFVETKASRISSILFIVLLLSVSVLGYLSIFKI